MMNRLYTILSAAALSLTAMSASAELVSGHRYTIQPYAEQTKYFCVSSADEWAPNPDDSNVRKNCVVYTDAPTADNGGIWVMTTTETTKWNFRPANEEIYGASHWLNPRTGNNIGNDLASNGNSAWTLTPVSGQENVYTLLNKQGRYMYYEADQEHPRWREGLVPSSMELFYFVITEVGDDEPAPEPEPVVDYSSYLPQLTTDMEHPVWYTMKSAKYGDYAQVVSPTNYMSLVEEATENTRFYFTGTVAKDENGYDYYDTFVIHTEFEGLEGKGLDGRNKWSDAGRQYEAAGVKYGDYEGVTIYRGTTNNILAWSDTNSLCSGKHVDYSSDSSDNSKEARVWTFELAAEPEPVLPDPTLKCVLELYDITPHMNGEDPTDFWKELNTISFTITGKYNGYPDMTIAGYNPELVATTDKQTNEDGIRLAGIYTYGGMEFVEPLSISLNGNDVVLNFDALEDGEYSVFFPDQLFRSNVTDDNCILITPVVKMRYRVNSAEPDGIISVECGAANGRVYDLQGRSHCNDGFHGVGIEQGRVVIR